MIKVSTVEKGLLLCAVRLLDSVHNSCHIISLCVFSSSPESIILSLPSCCQPFHLCHAHSDIPVCFFIASLLCAAPLLTGGHWSFMQSHCSVFRSSKHLQLSSHLCVLLFLPHLCVKSFYCSFLQPHAPSPTDLTEPLPAKWHWQIKNTSEHLSDLVFCMFMSLSVFIFWVPICHAEKPELPWFYCTSLPKTSPNLCSASSDARQEAAEEAR